MIAYDVYGSIIYVVEEFEEEFDRDFKIFKIEDPNRLVSDKEQEIIVEISNDPMPIRRLRDRKGAKLILDEYPSKVIVYVNQGTRMGSYAAWIIKPFMHWREKAFVHAASIGRNNNAIVIAGRGGIGKTIIALTLAKEGYEYLGDDWVIISRNGSVYPFPTDLSIYYYHIKLLDDVSRYMKRNIKLLIRLRVCNLIAKIALRILPGIPVSRISYVKIDPRNVIPDIKILKKDYKAKAFMYMEKVDGISKPIVSTIDDESEQLSIARILAGIWCSENMYAYKSYFKLKSLGITVSKPFEKYQDELEAIYYDFLKNVGTVLRIQIPTNIKCYREVISTIKEFIG